MKPIFYSHPSFQHHARPIGKMNPEVTKEKNMYVSVLVLSAILHVAIVAIITQRDK